MKVNKIQWSRIKAQWDILKMSSAYIHAESMIIHSSEKGVDLTGFMKDDNVSAVSYTSTSTSPESFHFEVSEFGELKRLDPKKELLEKAKMIREQLDQAILDEDYVRAELLQQTLNAIQTKYDKL